MTRAIHFLRRLRSLGYRAVSPVERWLLSAGDRRELPPLWLRRHVGDPGRFRSAARDSAELIDRLGLLAPGSVVLDVGCGCGAMVPSLLERVGRAGSYIGFDVHGPSIHWCRRRWAGEGRAVFHHAEIYSPYSTATRGEPLRSYRFPAPDRAVDLVLAKSVFTHMLGEDLSHYLREIERVLAPRGQALVSFFLFDDGAGIVPPAFPFPTDPAAVERWRRRRWRHAAVAFAGSHCRALIEDAGLEVALTVDGFWPGSAPEIRGQDVMVLRPRAAAVAEPEAAHRAEEARRPPVRPAVAAVAAAAPPGSLDAAARRIDPYPSRG